MANGAAGLVVFACVRGRLYICLVFCTPNFEIECPVILYFVLNFESNCYRRLHSWCNDETSRHFACKLAFLWIALSYEDQNWRSKYSWNYSILNNRVI